MVLMCLPFLLGYTCCQLEFAIQREKKSEQTHQTPEPEASDSAQANMFSDLPVMVPSVLPKFGGCSFISSANRLSLLPTTWPGHARDARTKLSRGFVITSAEALPPVIYNCRTKRKAEVKTCTRSARRFML